MKTFLTAVTAALSLCVLHGRAQTNAAAPAADSVKITKTAATVFGAVAFVPNLHYYGRTDSLKSSALLPTILVQFDSSGFYISGSAVFIQNTLQTMDYGAAITEAGYKFGKKKGLAGSIYADKFFYRDKQLVQSALQAQAGATISYLNKIVNINTGFITAFSNKTDFFASAGADHSFKFSKGKSVFVITPTAVAGAGTQSFTYSYYKKNNVLGFPLSSQQVTETSRRFNLLSYEFSMPSVWAYRKLFLVITPGYVIPKNVITVAGRPDISERAGNLFYTNLSILYTLKIKKQPHTAAMVK